jgi:hypothetical protein
MFIKIILSKLNMHENSLLIVNQYWNLEYIYFIGTYKPLKGNINSFSIHKVKGRGVKTAYIYIKSSNLGKKGMVLTDKTLMKR